MVTKKNKRIDRGIAVIGTGYWGRNLVRNYAELGVLKLICDKNEAVLAQLQQQYPGVEICLALNDILSREDIAGVVIATPAETHFNLAMESLLAGKHVYVEKPLVLQESHARELIELAGNRGLILMVGHLLQYHPAFVKLRELAASGELGRINYIYSHRLNLGKIRREENILWSFAPHDISMILALAGEDPETVMATGGNYLHRKIADVTTTHLEFPSGLKAHIFVSWLHPFKDQKLVVVGDRKMAVFDDTRPWEEKLLIYPHEIKWRNNIPVPSSATPECVHVKETEPLKLECMHFLQCIKSGIPPVTDGREGLRVLRVLNASQRSLNDSGRGKDMKSSQRGDVSATSDRETQPAESFFVHPTAVVDDDVSIGEETKIWFFSHILSGSRIGKNCNIGQNVMIGPDVVIGNACKIQNNVSIYKGVTLEDQVFCGPSMVFTNVFNPRAHIRRMSELRPTLVKKGATLGANCTVVCGNTIGTFAFIGAGAVVTKDVPDYALMSGNPARQTGWICECGEKLNQTLACPACNKHYVKKKKGLQPKGYSTRAETP
jgi:predicted dehydrogenase/acetyltransferase-like isoleucine patch superfamily enzyme